MHKNRFFLYDVPFVCHMCADNYVTYTWLRFEKYGQFPVESKKFQNFRFFLKIFSKLKLSHRAPGMSDFDAIGLIRQEIVHTFRILFKHKTWVPRWFAHMWHLKRKNRFLCLFCAHHHVSGVCTYLVVRTTLKFGIMRFQRRVPI